MTGSIYLYHYSLLWLLIKNEDIVVIHGNQIPLAIPLSQVNHKAIYVGFTLRVLHFLKTKRRACLSARPNFHRWTVRPVSHIPMTEITQDKSTGGIRHQYRILPSILTNRGVFKGKQMFVPGSYGGPSQASNSSKAEISSGPFPKFTYNTFGFLWRYLKQASQITEDFGISFYLFITKQTYLLRLPKLLILTRELTEFSGRATLPLTRPRNIWLFLIDIGPSWGKKKTTFPSGRSLEEKKRVSFGKSSIVLHIPGPFFKERKEMMISIFTNLISLKWNGTSGLIQRARIH